jgi:hypothetical protein
MRRIALALFVAALPLSVARAQSQATPPPPPVPSTTRTVVVTPRTTTSGERVAAPAITIDAQQTPRPATAVVTADRTTLMARVTPASWQNVKLDVTISDSLVPGTENRKMVSMLILDGLSGQVRSSAGEGLINIDARPTVRPDGRIWVQLTIEYRPELSGQQLQQAGLSRTALFSESLALLVADNKPVMASQSADPRSDRKVAIEIMAAVVK